MHRMKLRYIVLFCISYVAKQTSAGFIHGEPCSDRNTAEVNSTLISYPSHLVKCVKLTEVQPHHRLPEDQRLANADTLFADHMNLKAVGPYILRFLPKVQLLDLSGNYLRKFPRPLNRLTPHLKILLLPDNRIKVPIKGSFVRSLTLDTLMLSHNGIKKITHWTFSKVPRLRVLYLDRNDLTYITPGMFKHMENLQYLNLGSNRLHVMPSKALMPPKLRYYIIKGNNELVNIK